MKLRELKASDLGMVCKIITAIGLKEFKESFNVENIANATAERVGIEVIFGMGSVVIEHLPKAQKDIDIFLASVTGQSVEDIKTMGLVEYGDLIFEVIGKQEFRDFFSHALKLFNR